MGGLLYSEPATWTEIPKSVENRPVWTGCPLSFTFWDTSCLDMSLRIYREKILLIGHIRKLDNNTLAKQIYEETTSICSELSIEDCNFTHLDKVAYQKILTEALHKKS